MTLKGNIQDAWARWKIARIEQQIAGLGSFTNNGLAGSTWQKNASITVSFDGTRHTILCTGAGVAANPSWLDSSGNITEPGLYATILLTSFATSFTTNPQDIIIVNPVSGGQDYHFDNNQPLHGNYPDPFDMFALSAADLPYQPFWWVYTNTDATGGISVNPFVIQYLAL